jgi:uncharacterized protein (TIGR03067 family)
MRFQVAVILPVLLLILAVGVLNGADDAKQDAIKKELKSLQGSWVIVSLEHDDTRIAVPPETTMTFREDRYTLRMPMPPLEGLQTVEEGSVKIIEPMKKPKTFMLIPDLQKETRPKGPPDIYKVEGDTLTICEAPGAKEQPKEFNGKDGKKLSVWKRKKN